MCAVLELGATRLEPLEARATPEVESGACAYGADMGRYLTEVRRASWLREPVGVRGQPGLWQAAVPEASLPEGW